MSDRPRIVILDGHTANPGDLSWQALSELGELSVYPRSPDSVIERARDAEIVLTNKTVLARGQLEQLPQLRYVGVLATGTNVVDLRAAAERGIVVTNVPGYGAPAVAQHVFAAVLELTNRVRDHADAVAGGAWQRCRDFCFTVAPLRELDGACLGIVGVGAIGSRVAAIGAAFGMRIVAAHQRSEADVRVPGAELEWLPVDDVFARADVLTLHCPLTDETERLVNERRLRLMKPSALLVNTGRGGLVDEPALYRALATGRIAGAALDVLSEEPPSSGNPLIGAPRCTVTPHVAWATVAARQRLIDVAVDNVRAFLAGQPQNAVS